MPPKDLTNLTDEQRRSYVAGADKGPSQMVVFNGRNYTIGGAPQISPETPATSVESITNPPKPFNVPSPYQSQVPDTSFLDTAFQQTQEEQKAQSDVDLSLEALRQLTDKEGTKTARATEISTAEGIPDMNKQVKEIYDQIRTNNVQAFTQSQIAEDRRAPNFAIQGDQQSFERQRAVKNYSLAAQAEALQGNIALAQQRVDSAIAAEFEPLKAKIDFQKTLIESNYSKLDAASKRAADKRLAKLNERERLLAEESTTKSNISNVMLSAAQSGADNETLNRIMNAKSVDEAVSYSAPFLNKKDTQVIKFENGDTALINSQTGQVIKNFGGSKIDQTVNQFTSTGLGGAAQVLSSKFSGKFQQEAFTNNVNRFVNNGDEQGLADYIFSTAIETLPDAEQRKKAISQYKIVNKLTDLQTKLDAYEAAGGKTNLFRGTKEDILARLGTVSDPALRDLGIQIQDTLDGLARDRTGAVITESEEKFYNRLLPGTYKTADLNRATINGLKSSMTTDLNSALKFQLTGSGFDSIEPYLGTDKAQTTQTPNAPQVDQSLLSRYNAAKGTDSQSQDYDLTGGIADFMNRLFGGF